MVNKSYLMHTLRKKNLNYYFFNKVSPLYKLRKLQFKQFIVLKKKNLKLKNKLLSKNRLKSLYIFFKKKITFYRKKINLFKKKILLKTNPLWEILFSDLLFQRLVNHLIKNGKKEKAFLLFYNCFIILKSICRISPLYIIKTALQNIRPFLKLKVLGNIQDDTLSFKKIKKRRLKRSKQIYLATFHNLTSSANFGIKFLFFVAKSYIKQKINNIYNISQCLAFTLLNFFLKRGKFFRYQKLILERTFRYKTIKFLRRKYLYKYKKPYTKKNKHASFFIGLNPSNRVDMRSYVLSNK